MRAQERLRCAASHVAAIRRMVEDDAPAPVVLTQIQAVQGSLRAVARMLIAYEVRRRLASAGMENASEVAEEMERLLLSLHIRR